jgi:hypothetical protein
MSRLLYRLLLRLHPPNFRDRYSDEMLCMFDELAAERSGFFLVADGVSSLSRQWFVGVGLWKAIVAIVLAMLPVIFVLDGVARHQRRWARGPEPPISGQSFPANWNRQN